MIWGAGYRHTSDQTLGTIDQAFLPPNSGLQLFTFFVQDAITLIPDRVFLTVGTKIENSYFNGFGIQPSVRLAWSPSNRMTFWTAVSRATRSPDRTDAGLNAGLAAFPDPSGAVLQVLNLPFRFAFLGRIRLDICSMTPCRER